jgi:DNA-binding CsgD family transcriptional regulator
MFDVSRPTDFNAPGDAAPPPSGPAHYRGPERRNAPARSRHWLAATLDEVDYGMLLLTRETHAIHVNHAARSELDDAHPLQLLGRELRARRPHDVVPLAEALQAAARRGLRKLLTLGDGAQRVGVSVVPLSMPEDAAEPVTLVMLGKRQVCEQLSVQGFARSHKLTAAETRVLAALCRGVPPNEIAAQVGVAISTVRTQIGNIRQKTGAESIRALVQQVAVLPPLMGVLRGAGLVADAAANDRGVACL